MAIFLAAVSLVIALATAYYTRRQAELTRLSISAQSYLAQNEAWSAMTKTRAAAARQLIDLRQGEIKVDQLYQGKSSDVDAVLDALESIAFFANEGLLDLKLVYNMYYWWIENYLIACDGYIRYVTLSGWTAC